jgi:hypothetical protein
LVALDLTEDSKADVDRNADQRAAAGGRRGLVTLGGSEGSDAGVDGDADQATGGGLLLALNISEDGGAETDRHVDERAATTTATTATAGRRDLVTLGRAKSSDTGINRHADQTTGRGLLLALSISEDGGAKINGDVNERAATAAATTAAAGRRDLVTLGRAKSSDAGINGHADQTAGRALLLALNISEDSSAEVDRNVDKRAATARGGSLVTLGGSKSSDTGIHRHTDQTISGSSGLALSLSQDSSTKADWDADERAAATSELVALGRSQCSDASINRHTDQTISESSAVALGLSQNSSTKIGGDGDQVLMSLNTL